MRNLLGPNAILTAPAKAHKKQRQILSQVNSLNEQEGSLIAMLFKSIPQAVTFLTHNNEKSGRAPDARRCSTFVDATHLRL